MFDCLAKCGSASKQNPVIHIPKKRKKRARCMSITICAITAVLIIVFCVLKRSVVEYYPDATQKNTTNVCYREKKVLTFPGLFTTALSLFGVVLGTLVDRLSLIAEEGHHIKSRYDESRIKMIKACFSGISWGPVIALLGLAAVILVILKFVAGKPWFELSYLVYIFSGIGVGPLIMQLLSLNTQSEVHISTIFEEKQTNVANGLAWSYYFNYLEKALPNFNESVPRNGCKTIELEQGQQGEVELSSNKLILFITHDCKTEDLEKLNDNIKKLGSFTKNKYYFPVYELTYNGCKYRYVIKYVRQPLETLDKMSQYGRIKILDEKQREYQVKLLYKTLSEILEDPFNKECEDKCVLVGIHANSKQCLNNGELVRVIKKQVEANKSTPEDEDGIIQVYTDNTGDFTPRKKTKKPNNSKIIRNTEENVDTPLIAHQEVDDACGASTSGIQMANLQPQQDSV